MKEPIDIRVATNYEISRAEYIENPERVDSMAAERMRHNIANFIQDAKVETKEFDNHIEKRLELYVATPEEFWQIVQREADKIAIRFRTNQ